MCMMAIFEQENYFLALTFAHLPINEHFMLHFFGTAVCGQLNTEMLTMAWPSVINERAFFDVNLAGKTNRFESIITSIPALASIAVHFIIGSSDGKAAELRIMVSQNCWVPEARPNCNWSIIRLMCLGRSVVFNCGGLAFKLLFDWCQSRRKCIVKSQTKSTASASVSSAFSCTTSTGSAQRHLASGISSYNDTFHDSNHFAVIFSSFI